MKKIVLIIILSFYAVAFAKAQNDYCNDISKSINNSTIYYNSPTSVYSSNNPILFSFSKAFYTDGSLSIFLNLGNPSKNNVISTSDILIKFEDDDQLSYYSPFVERTYNPYTDDWKYTTSVKISSDDLNKFKTKKVKSFIFVKVAQYSFSDDFKNKIIAYANCIDTLQNNK